MEISSAINHQANQGKPSLEDLAETVRKLPTGGGQMITATFVINGETVTRQVAAPKLALSFNSYSTSAAESSTSAARANQTVADIVKSMLQFNLKEKKAASEIVNQKTLAAQDKLAAEKTMAPWQKFMSWLGNIAAIAGSIVGIIAGAAAVAVSGPGGVALIAISVIGLFQGLAKASGDIAKDCGHDVGEISIGRGFAEGWVALCSLGDTPGAAALRNDKDYRDKVLMGLSIAIELVSSVASIVTGAAAGKIVAKAAEISEKVIRVQTAAINAAAQILDHVSQGVEGLSDIGYAAIDLGRAWLRAKAGNDTAHQSFAQGELDNLSQQFDRLSQLLEMSVQNLLKLIETSTSVVKQSDTSIMAIQRNMLVSRVS